MFPEFKTVRTTITLPEDYQAMNQQLSEDFAESDWEAYSEEERE